MVSKPKSSAPPAEPKRARQRPGPGARRRTSHDDDSCSRGPKGPTRCPEHLSSPSPLSATGEHATLGCSCSFGDGWWRGNQGRFPQTQVLLLNLDNGPENHSHRSQFLYRLVRFAQTHRLLVRLAYYPPYHSKYNPIERCWGALENYWNGALLNSVEAAVGWAKTMTWRGVTPIV